MAVGAAGSGGGGGSGRGPHAVTLTPIGDGHRLHNAYATHKSRTDGPSSAAAAPAPGYRPHRSPAARLRGLIAILAGAAAHQGAPSWARRPLRPSHEGLYAGAAHSRSLHCCLQKVREGRDKRAMRQTLASHLAALGRSGGVLCAGAAPPNASNASRAAPYAVPLLACALRLIVSALQTRRMEEETCHVIGYTASTGEAIHLTEGTRA